MRRAIPLRAGMMLRVAAAALLAVSLAAGAAPKAHARAMEIGMVDDPLFFHARPSVRREWLGRGESLGATAIRLPVYWKLVAPRRLPRQGFQPTDPADPHYNFAPVDAAVRDAAARHLKILLIVRDAPGWAQRSDRPRRMFFKGVWWPNAAEFGQFGQAVAQRYSGHFADPRHPGQDLPRVRYLQAWNEPNLPNYLAPQWGLTPRGHHIIPLSPRIYRALLNAFYAGVKAVVPSDVVVAAATAPYGDPPGRHYQRMYPVSILENLFCLTSSLRPTHCPDPPHLDVLDHHPYSLSPIQPAAFSGDISVVDLWKIKHIAAAADRYRHVIPRGPKPLWVTELDWSDARPLNPALQARFLAEGLYELWRQGVSLAMWFFLRDPSGVRNSFKGAGLYYRSGRAKPAVAAFRFPFCAVPVNSSDYAVWGRAPSAGQVTIEALSGSGWRALASVRTGAGNYFETQLPLAFGTVVRAVAGHTVSPSWDTNGRY